jgi:Arc/MetJ-type ribon-helix-helix transcriptional regulator
VSEKDLVVLSVKIPKQLAEALEEELKRDTHVTKSEIVREALREWLERRQSKGKKRTTNR